MFQSQLGCLLDRVRAWLAPGPGPLASVFTNVYHRNLWLDPESRSGPGSSLARTVVVREALARALRDLRVRTLLDAPCGDFNWMQAVDLSGVEYIGVDIVADLVASLRRALARPGRQFLLGDLTVQPLPCADLVLCRDCLVHLPTAAALAAVANFRRSGSTCLLTTTFPAHEHNEDVAPGGWRPLNLERPPFRFPPPLRLDREGCPVPGFADKSLGLWRLADLP